MGGKFKIKATMAMINKLGANTTNQLITTLTSIDGIVSTTYGIVTPSKAVLKKDLLSIKKSNLHSSMASGYIFSREISKNPQQYQSMDNAHLIYDGKLTLRKKQTELLSNEFIKDHIRFAQKLILNGTGAFVFCIVKKKQLLIGRDSIGIQPFYYGENKTHFVFASNRKILWNLKIEKPKIFPPGQLCIANKSGLRFQIVKQFKNSIPISLDLKNASKILLKFLENSISTNVKGLEKCAIAFSGGIDSSLIAYLAKKYVKKVQLIHVSLTNGHEINYAKKVAKILNLPIRVYQFKESDVQEIISKVLWIIEEPDPIKVSIGIPFYWLGEKTKQLNFDVLLAGQGADELFGGYQRYLNMYLSKDWKTTKNQIYTDVVNMHENNLARDMKICNFHGISLLCPFLSTKLVDFALKLPIELKLERKRGSLRKLILRQVGRNLGLESLIVEKPKKAIQYSTGVNKVLKRLAKKKNKSILEYINSKFQKQ